MDLAWIVLWTAGAGAFVGLIQFLLSPGPGRTGWIAVHVLSLVLAAGGSLFSVDAGAAAGGVFWIVFVLVPQLAARAVDRRLMGQRYGSSLALVRLVALLHPADGWREMPAICRALHLASLGEAEASRAILASKASATSARALPVAAFAFQLAGDWEGLLAWADAEACREAVRRDAGATTGLVRAWGEIGRFDRLVEVLDGSRSVLAGNPKSMAMSRLFLFAFAGRREEVERLLEGPLAALDASIGRLWIATADLAAGRHEAAAEVLGELRRSGDARLARSAARRLAHPPRPVDLLSSRIEEVLDRESRDSAAQDRFERGAHPRLRPRATQTVAALALVGFLLESVSGGSTDPGVLLALGALEPSSLLEQGEWWRLLTAPLLHFGPVHLAINLLGLLVLGRHVEQRVGHARAFAILLASGVAAGIPYLVAWLVRPTPALVVGASGAVMGLLGSILVDSVRTWRDQASIAARSRTISIGALVALQTAYDSLTPIVSLRGHLAGLFVGALLFAALRPRDDRAPPIASASAVADPAPDRGRAR